VNRKQLDAALLAAGVNPRNFSLTGGLPNDAVCLDTLPLGRWVVYYSERGSRFDVVEFDTESAACAYLLGLLVREPSVQRIDPVEDRPHAEDE
jgi:hypothetical protein